MAIDPNETKNSLFGGLKKAEPTPEIEPEKIKQPEPIQQTVEEPKQQEEKAEQKWQSFDKVTALLTTEQKEGLDRVAKKIMKYRSRDLKGHESKERITANTLIRALIDIFLEKEADSDMKILADEEAVKEWVKSL